jgi:hypothetical protein
VLYFPPELPAGPYTIITGLYDPDSGQRLATADGADALEIGRVLIS